LQKNRPRSRPVLFIEKERIVGYELYYWPTIQGRGEFVRLALEASRADYVDVARESGVDAMLRLMRESAHPPFAPPFLRAGKLLIAQSANILQYLGSLHGLAPKSESGRIWAHQLQLTVADFVDEVHDTHHPIASSLYYQDQIEEAKRRAEYFLAERIPKYLGHFENVVCTNGKTGYSIGRSLTYVDLSLFQIIAGLRYAFPKTTKRLEKKYSHLIAVHDRVANRPAVAAYLKSPRRIPFNEHGVFRHYPELDS
jgi:glutathione S-transferase